jgi:hypothetical protein
VGGGRRPEDARRAVRQDARPRERQRRSAFVPIPTVPDDERSAAHGLAESRGWVHIARQCPFRNDPWFVDALYVKKPERIEALGYVLWLAWLLYSLVERRI